MPRQRRGCVAGRCKREGQMPRRGVRRAVRYEAEYLLLRGAVGLLKGLPYRFALRLAEGFGSLAFAVVGSRRRIAVENVLRSGICATEADAVRVARASFRHMGAAGLESLKFVDLLENEAWRQHVRVHMPAALIEPVDDGWRSAVVASAHLGNWEIGGNILSCHRPVVAIARPMDNPKVDRYVNRIRFHSRFENLPKHMLRTRDLVDVLRDGGALAVMIDQHAGKRGMVLDFLGRPASTNTSVARLSRTTGSPVFFGTCVRRGPLAYDLRVVGPLHCARTRDREADVRELLQDLNGRLEAAIRENPEQYMWAHRRWRVS